MTEPKPTAIYNKPGIPLTLSHGKRLDVAPGDVATLTLTVTPMVDGVAIFDLASDTGLVLRGAANRRMDISGGVLQTLDVDVSSAISGRHYLNVVASIEGISGTRALSIPVQVGKGGVIGKSAPGTLSIDADGGATIAMPATETIDGVVVIDPSQDIQQPR